MDLIGNGVYLLWMSNRRAHLWGFGFNQFGQINDTEEDVYSPVCIDSFDVTADEVDCGIVCWAGWADLLCTSSLSQISSFQTSIKLENLLGRPLNSFIVARERQKS